MIYLLLAILSSTLISVLMRLGDKDIKNDMVMFMANYAICMVLSGYFMRDHVLAFAGNGVKGITFAVIIGLLSGIMYLVNFVLLHFNINRNGVVLSSMFMRLGVLVPTVMAVILFQETAKITQVIGFVAAILAIILINLSKDDSERSVGQKITGRIWLLVLLLMSGLTDSLANIYDKKGVSELKDLYLLFTFFAACILCILFVKVKKQHFTMKDTLWGLAIGVPNYFSARFLLLSLGALPAILVYPVYNVATILCISIFGIFLFKEKMERQKQIGLLLILISLVFLNI